MQNETFEPTEVQTFIEETESGSVEPDQKIDDLASLVSAKVSEMAKVAIEQSTAYLHEEMEFMVSDLDTQLESTDNPEEAVAIVGDQLEAALKARVTRINSSS